MPLTHCTVSVAILHKTGLDQNETYTQKKVTDSNVTCIYMYTRRTTTFVGAVNVLIVSNA